MISLGGGLATRLNPLDVAGDRASTGAARAGRAQLLVSLAETTLHRDLYPAEHTAIDVAVSTADTRTGGTPTIPDVVTALAQPDPGSGEELLRDGRDLAHGLRRLVTGDLSGLFDGPSTVSLDDGAPMVVLDLSRLSSHDEALAIAMSCASSWLEASLASGGGHRWVIYDEAWRLLHMLPLLRRMQAQWKLSRALGIANLIVLHRLTDLDAVGAAGTATRSLAEGLLADCSTRVVYRQESDQLTGTATALGLTSTERELLPALPRGTGLWKVGRASHLVHHRLHPDEAAVFDTDAAMVDLAVTQ